MMTMDQIDAFIADGAKVLASNIDWSAPQAPVLRYEFREEIQHTAGNTVKVYLKIWFNPSPTSPKLQFAYYEKQTGRIFGWCLGSSHEGMNFHQHYGPRCSESVTPLPASIARLVNNPSRARIAFCHQSSLTHTGNFFSPTGQPWSTLRQI